MYVGDKIYLAMNNKPLYLLPSMSNRHGLICGATGTGKTITLKVIAESFSEAGVPVFLSDIKGDLAGMCLPGADSENMQKRIAKFHLAEAGFTYTGYPVHFWDVFGRKGLPVRATVSEMGPLFLSRILGLNETQEGVLNIVFRIADDQNLLLLDLKDLRQMVQFVGDNAKAYKTIYGNITAASIGAIQRGLLKLEEQGAEDFFGEPALDLADWFAVDSQGRGFMNILNCEELFLQPELYSTVMLWMLSELYENLPEVGDLEKPRMVFFFDEAHLLFKDAPKELLSKIEQIVRLIRSKGVGVFFITQKPTDIPDTVLSQLGNRIEHALRAYSATDLKAVKTAAMTFRQNPMIDAVEAIQQLGTGEALVQFLDEDGVPMMVEQAKILPPRSLMGAAPDGTVEAACAADALNGKYAEAIDRVSAYELLTHQAEAEPSGFDANFYEAAGYTARPESYEPAPAAEYPAGAYVPDSGVTIDPATGQPLYTNPKVGQVVQYDPVTGKPVYYDASAALNGTYEERMAARDAKIAAAREALKNKNAAAGNAAAQAQYASGQNAAGQNAAGQYAAGQYSAGQYAAGQNAAGQYAAGQYAAGQNAAGQYAAGKYAAGQYAPAQNAAGQYAAGQYAAGQYAQGQYASGQPIVTAPAAQISAAAAAKEAEKARKAAEKEAEKARKAAEREAEKKRKEEEKLAAEKAKEEARKAREREKMVNKIVGNTASSFMSTAARQFARGIFGNRKK